MNQKEWNRLVKSPKEKRGENFFYFRNLAQKILGYRRNTGYTIHHLRDTEEQRIFNDTHYERWGIDFDGQMKYCVLMTTEEHSKLHHTSEETKCKLSKSVSIAKKRYTDEELKEHKREQDKRYVQAHKADKSAYDKAYYERNKERIKERVRLYKRRKKAARSSSK